MSKRTRGMGITGAMVLLFLGGVAGMTIRDAASNMWTDIMEDEPYASISCKTGDGLGGNLGGVGFNSGAELDSGCASREASRMAPDEARKEFMWCSLPSSQRAFGSVTACLEYNGDNQALIQQVQERINYCEKRSKKWYKRITLQKNRAYDKCMNKYQGGLS